MLGVTYKQEDEINATNFKITNIWHMKLGHTNQQGQKLNLVCIQRLGSFYDNFFSSICPSSIKGKQYDIKFLKEHQKFKKFWNLYIVMYA
jgi:hypothetical protein